MIGGISNSIYIHCLLISIPPLLLGKTVVSCRVVVDYSQRQSYNIVRCREPNFDSLRCWPSALSVCPFVEDRHSFQL